VSGPGSGAGKIPHPSPTKISRVRHLIFIATVQFRYLTKLISSSDPDLEPLSFRNFNTKTTYIYVFLHNKHMLPMMTGAAATFLVVTAWWGLVMTARGRLVMTARRSCLVMTAGGRWLFMTAGWLVVTARWLVVTARWLVVTASAATFLWTNARLLLQTRNTKLLPT